MHADNNNNNNNKFLAYALNQNIQNLGLRKFKKTKQKNKKKTQGIY